MIHSNASMPKVDRQFLIQEAKYVIPSVLKPTSGTTFCISGTEKHYFATLNSTQHEQAGRGALWPDTEHCTWDTLPGSR